jgi:hypothetical protein
MPCSFTDMVFQDINMFGAPPDPYQDPMTDRHRWTIPVLSTCLKARRCTAPYKWKVGQLREKVYVVLCLPLDGKPAKIHYLSAIPLCTI